MHGTRPRRRGGLPTAHRALRHGQSQAVAPPHGRDRIGEGSQRSQSKLLPCRAEPDIARVGVAPHLPRDAYYGRPEISGALPQAVIMHVKYEGMPADAKDWDVTVPGATTFAATLASHRADAETFKLLATVRTDADVGTVDDWKWTGPTADFRA